MPPAAAEDQRPLPLPWRGLLQDAQRRGAVVEDGRGVEKVDAVGHGNAVLEVDRCQFGVATGAAAPPVCATTGRPRQLASTPSPTTATVPPTPLPGT